MKFGNLQKYGLCILLSAALIAAAFFLPDLAMGWIDRQSQSEYSFESRNELDYAVVNARYETDCETRLNAFARSFREGSQHFIISSNAELKEEDLYGTVFGNLENQEAYWILFDALSDSFLSSYTLLRRENYLIYDGDANGSVLLCWYLEMINDDGCILRLVMDAVDQTIYYGEVYGWNSESFANVMEEYYQEKSRKRYWENMGGLFLAMSCYYQVQDQEEIRAFLNEYMENGMSYIVQNQEKNDGKAKVSVTIDLEEVFPRYGNRLSGALDYADGTLTYDFRYVKEDGISFRGIGSGIREIYELLPDELIGDLIE